jgi:hypothetical protein
MITAADPTAPDVSQNPIVIYAAIAVVLFLAAGTITNRGLGPISQWWFDFAKRRREASTRRDDADIAELRRTVTNLQGMLEAVEERRQAKESADSARMARMEEFVDAVAEWGFIVRQRTKKAGVEIPPFPKLKHEES